MLKRFEEIQDFIYSHDGLSPQQTLEEFVKVLFIKIFDEQSGNNRFVFADDEREGVRSADKINVFTNRIASLFNETKKQYEDVFDKDDRIRLSENVLGFIVDKLQNISLLASANDVKGLAFQKFLSHYEKGGRGQFFTPEPVIDFCVKMIDPKEDETIIDPACGSGGFLFAALEHLRNHSAKTAADIIKKQLYGIDISQSITRIARMKLILEANCDTNIFCFNTLESIDSVRQKLGTHDGFDIVLTNPPFGAKISETHLLSSFDLGHKWVAHQDCFSRTKILHNSQTAEILFIERSLQLLKDGGRMAIVLPNGNFDNSSLAYLRYYIKDRADVLAVVRLPQETFIPYGTGVKTSILFLQKKSHEKHPPKTFFSAILKLGYQGNKNGTPVFRNDKYGKPIKIDGQSVLDEDFTDVVRDFQRFKTGKNLEYSFSYSIDYSQLNGRFDYDYYSPQHRKFIDKLTPNNSVRLGDICKIVKEKSKKLKCPDALVEYVELSDVNTNSFEIINSTSFSVHELPSRASYEIQTGDIITAIAGNSVGTRKHATALVAEEYNGCICTNGFRIFRDVQIDPYFFLFFLKSDMFLNQMFMLRTGAAIPNVSDTDLANVRIYLPEKLMIESVSQAMKKSFDLRTQSRLLIEQITL
ncbi:MAG: N-6 DNA methylase [Planctomycetaceae bacterium]|nr:N-6 DNA methylase [Planctomycetaceae bacterium]